MFFTQITDFNRGQGAVDQRVLMYIFISGIIRDLDRRMIATTITCGDWALADVCNKRAITNLMLNIAAQ